MFDALEQKFKDTDQADFINNLYQGLIKLNICFKFHILSHLKKYHTFFSFQAN